jgi:F0F1-type ATP synthase assembly protein I
MPETRIGSRWVFILALKLVGITILPILLGLTLDRHFQLSPILTLSMMLLGLNLGIFTIARSVAAIYARIEQNLQRIGGDR